MGGGRWVPGAIVLSGQRIFQMVDTHGFPLWMLHELMRERGMYFNVKEFILTAKASGNYENPDRLRTLLYDNMLEHEDKEKIKANVEVLIKAAYE